MLKLRHKFGYLIAYFTWAMYTFSSPVFASNAVSDIMNNERFQGAIDSIEWLTIRVDYWFTVIISATSFFIISAALMKNAFAAAYCANHKFWDAVDEAHQKSAAWNIEGLKGFFTNKQFMQMSAGSVKDALLGIVPNIKAFTDFDEDDIEPKRYFMKAIPQMLICVIIGVFIYNGYYRDTAAMVGEFGSEICRRTFASVDPVQFVNKLTQTSGTPDNIFKNDATIQGEHAYELSTALYKAWLNECKDLTSKEHKTELMRDCENQALQKLQSFEHTAEIYGSTRAYDYDINGLSVELVSGSTVPDQSKKISENDTKKYSVRFYTEIPNACTSYVDNSLRACVTLVFNGHDRDGSKSGTTNIKTAPGSWNNTSNVTVTQKLQVPQGKTEIVGGKTVTNDDVLLTIQLNNIQNDVSAANSQVMQYLAEQKYSNISVQGVTISGYESGGGQSPKIRVSKGTELPYSRNLKLRVRFNATKGETSNVSSYSVIVNLKVEATK